MSSIRIVIADDHPVLRAGLKLLLEEEPDMVVTATVATGIDAHREVERGGVDVVVFDLSMPGGGLACLRELAALRAVRVVVLTQHESRAYIDAALRDGARAYLSKRSTPEEIIAAIRAVVAGNLYVQASLDYHPTQSRAQGAVAIDSLSPRELQVLGLVVRGHTNREIAEQLDVSVKTIEGYRARVLEKLGARTRAELVEYAMVAGLLPMAAEPLEDN